MDIRVIEQVLEELKANPPREIIPSTMGEPLLYHHFEAILALCHRYGIRLNLTTNGTFPKHGALGWAKKIVPIGSDVKISFNGTQPETQERIMLQSRLESALSNIRTFISVRDEHAARGGNYCSVTLQTTFMEQNLSELPKIIRLAAGLNADRVKGHHLWVHFPEMRDQDLRRSPESVARWNEALAECQLAAVSTTRPGGGIVKLENFAPLTFSDAKAAPDNSECPFLGREAWINNSGRFDPCCAPDNLRLSLGSFGRVQEQGFLTIWRSKQYRGLVSGYRNHPLCTTCLMRREPAATQS
jgi:MoaA/NifB/PqqE/SkfB family radical SAM enzyme